MAIKYWIIYQMSGGMITASEQELEKLPEVGEKIIYKPAPGYEWEGVVNSISDNRITLISQSDKEKYEEYKKQIAKTQCFPLSFDEWHINEFNCERAEMNERLFGTEA